jgi:hypothetical protein
LGDRDPMNFVVLKRLKKGPAVVWVRITPEAHAAILAQFELLEMIDPGLGVYHDVRVIRTSSQSDGSLEVTLGIDEAVSFEFMPLTHVTKNLVELDAVRIVVVLATADGDEWPDQTDVTFFVSKRCLCLCAKVADSCGGLDVAAEAIGRGMPLGLIDVDEILEPSPDRLRLLGIYMDVGRLLFHSLQWDRWENGQWQTKGCIARKQLKDGSRQLRWVAGIRSFNPETGLAVIKIAESARAPWRKRPAKTACSWCEWDLATKAEVRKLEEAPPEMRTSELG